MEKKEIKDWRTRLRELYLDENDGSSFMKEIIFNWGTFSFTPNLKHRPMNYYIATQESIEDFISQELEKAREEVLRELLKKAVLPVEARFMKHRIMEYNNGKSKLKE